VQHVPSEMERRYRLCITGRGDAGASLFRCLSEEGGGSSAWAAHVLSRLYLVRGRMGLARSFLDLSTEFFERDFAGGIPPGLEINRALILWSEGESREAERILRRILQHALDRDHTFVASKAASNLSMILARTERPAEAASFNGLAATCYRARGYTEGVIRVELNGALIEGASGRPDEAVDRITRVLSREKDRFTERERAAGTMLLAEMFLSMDDLERAGEALRLAYNFRRALKRFSPIRLRLLSLAGLYRLRRGERTRAERLARNAERMRIKLGLRGLEYGPPESPPQSYVLSGLARLTREAPVIGCGIPRNSEKRFVTVDQRMLRLLAEIRRAAPLTVPVLVRGETGVGKELVGRLIHQWSGRGNAPFLPVNAAALTRELFESTLFGHVKGAFTGAVAERRGLLMSAGLGTVFLDEIAELDTALQAKLLRFLDSGEYLPVGSDGVRISGARIVAATNRDLEELMERGSFRKDLFYRFSVLTFTLPPLRARPRDVPILLDRFLREAAERPGLGPFTVSEEARALLMAYDWPGNVRELESEILRAAVRARSGVIRVAHLSSRLLGCLSERRDSFPTGLDRRIADFEREEIEDALSAADGNRSRAARILGLKRTTLLYRMRRHGIDG
jgi:transcriptional regulator with AAA-type ATPase domain